MPAALESVAEHPRVVMASLMDHSPGVGQYRDIPRYRAMRQRQMQMSEAEVTREIERYVVWPGQATAYKVGQLAILRARARADLYASASGMRVVRVISIAEAGQNDGGSPVVPMMVRAMKADAATEIAPGEKDVTVTLSVRYLLQ